jgi:enoyl-CoA hydratase
VANVTESADVTLVDRGSYAVLSLTCPEKLNCLTESMLTSLEAAFREYAGWANHRALVVTGSDGVFSVGADLAALSHLDARSARAFSQRGQALMSSVSRIDSVTIAAIDGYCLGGGLDLALSCDLRYASTRSSFQHPGVKRGIITGWGGNVPLPALIGRDAARRYFITGKRISASEAETLGLINASCDRPLEAACEIAAAISGEWSSPGIAEAKRACQPELVL